MTTTVGKSLTGYPLARFDGCGGTQHPQPGATRRTVNSAARRSTISSQAIAPRKASSATNGASAVGSPSSATERCWLPPAEPSGAPATR